jgi:site-specific recombinase XerC
MEYLPIPVSPEPTQVDAVTTEVDVFLAAALAPSTRLAYGRDWSAWVSWCQDMGLTALPAAPGALRAWLAYHAYRLSLATLRRRLAAINRAHAATGYPPPGSAPEVRDILQGIRRLRAGEVKRAAPLSLNDIRAMLGVTPDTVAGMRDRALILLGFAAGLRRAEIAGLRRQDVVISSAGLDLTLPGSDQRELVLPGRALATCPVRAVQAWVEGAGITDGALIRSVSRHGTIGSGLSGRAVDLIVKRLAAAAGLAGHFSASSLRAGWAANRHRRRW